MGREEGSGWGPRVCLWRIHFDVWQNPYNILKFKSKIKKKRLYVSPCLFNLYAEYILRNAGMDESQAGVKIAREILTTSDM